MIDIADFLTTILKRILKQPLVSNKYASDYHISRNSFSYYIKRNTKLTEAIADTLKQIIIKEISKDKIKEKKILDYLTDFLTDNEKQSVKNIHDIISLVLLKITNIDNQDDRSSLSHLQYDKKFKALSLYDIQNLNLNLKSLLTQAMYLDNEVLDHMPPEHEGTLEQWLNFCNEYPETWRYILDENNKIIGNWSFVPLFENVFKDAKSGLIFDGALDLNMTPMLVPGTYNIYFVEICLSNRYKGTSILRLLLNSIAQAFENLANDDIFINEICTQAYTLDGVRLCKSLGLKYHKNHVDCGEIYCGNIRDLLNQPFCKNAKTLKDLYAKHFKTQSSS